MESHHHLVLRSAEGASRRTLQEAALDACWTALRHGGCAAGSGRGRGGAKRAHPIAAYFSRWRPPTCGGGAGWGVAPTFEGRALRLKLIIFGKSWEVAARPPSRPPPHVGIRAPDLPVAFT